MSRTPKAALSDDQMRWFCEFLRDRSGMLFGANKRYYIERRLHDRLRATGCPEFEAYFVLLRADPVEAAAMVDAFTINETYFYREDHQFRCLTQDLLPQVAQRRSGGSAREQRLREDPIRETTGPRGRRASQKRVCLRWRTCGLRRLRLGARRR